MSAAPRLDLPTLDRPYLAVRCNCVTPMPPLRLQWPGVSVLKRLIQATTEVVDGDAEVLTYRCHRCKGIAHIRLRDMGLL